MTESTDLDLSHRPSNAASTTAAVAGAASLDARDVGPAADLPALLPTPLPDDPLGVTIHRLANGLTVYLSVDNEQPRVHAWIAIRAGSRHDPAHSTGLAHYLEHMMFKGTPKLGTLDGVAELPHLERTAALYDRLPHASSVEDRASILAEIDAATQASAQTAIPNEIDRLYAALGILDVNAFTSDEATVYLADLPAARLEAWAHIEAERLARPSFRLFYPELEAVYEEKNTSLDSPEDRVDEALRLALFPGHPYGTQPTLGIAEHLKNPAHAEMVAYHRRWYVPNNAAIILAGDLDPAATLATLELAFSTWSPGQVTPLTPGELLGPVGRVERIVEAEGEQSVTLAWRTVPAGHPDEPALAVLAELIDNDVCGLLNVNVLLAGLLPDAETHGEQLLEAGYHALTGVARDDQSLAEVERLLLAVIAELKAGAFTEAELAAIVLHRQIREQMARESNSGRVAWIADAYLAHRPWDEHLGLTAAIARVTREDILRVAHAYFGDDRVVVLRRRGKHDPPKIPRPIITPVPIDATRESAFAAEILARPSRDPEPAWLTEDRDFSRLRLASGRLIAAPNTRSQLFALAMRWELGTRQRPLLGYALELLQQSGAGSLAADELQRRLYQLGTTIDTDCGADHTSVILTGVDANLEASLALLDTWLRAPSFTADTVSDLLANILSLRRDEQDDPEALAEALSEFARRGPGSDILARPSNRQLKQARGADLADELRVLSDLSHHTLYFGPRSPAAAAAALEFGAGNPVAPRPPRRLRTAERPTIYFVHRDMAQAQIEVVLPLPPLLRADRPAARLLNHVLGGDMSGLVFQEIREARGLAYRAGAYLAAGARPCDASALIGQLGTQADKSREALTLLLDLMQRPTLTAERVTAGRSALVRELRSTRIPPRRVPDWVQAWEEREEPHDPRPEEFARLEALGRPHAAEQALGDLLRRHTGDPALISVLGDRRRIDLAGLRELGELIELRATDLFSHARTTSPTGATSQPAR
ncbi:MAG: insulinase family protein [Nannocystis sp.]|nr:M16 family metallopeptidase [Nannocystis sp.]MBA3550125.1 insulinase family protein [Nannocystis sp.]